LAGAALTVSLLLYPRGMGMHSYSKEQREVVRQLIHLVLIRDMGTFSAERFKDWIKETDQKFRKVALTLGFRISNRTVHFTVKEVRTRRTAFQFEASTHVQFEDRDVVSVEDTNKQF
jgi:hypothetical protein